MSVRACSMSGNAIDLAPQDPVSCDTGDYGWNGGYLDVSFNYAMNTGVVLGSWFPYVSGNGAVPPCPNKWTGTGSWTKYKCKSGSIINVGGNRDAMKN